MLNGVVRVLCKSLDCSASDFVVDGHHDEVYCKDGGLVVYSMGKFLVEVD